MAKKKKPPPESTPGMVPIKPKLYARFFEPVALLYTLDPVRGQREDHERPVDDLEGDEVWHGFLNDVAYICDTHRGGDTVTAAALADDGEGIPLLVLACNSRIKPKVLEVLQNILKRLGQVNCDNREEMDSLEREILEQTIELDQNRLRDYRRQVKNRLEQLGGNPKMMKSFDEYGQDFLNLLDRLRSIIEKENFLDIVKGCHLQGSTNIMRRIRSELENNNRDNPAQIVSELRHYVGRLGRHVKVVESMMRAARAHRSVFSSTYDTGIPIKLISTSMTETGPLRKEKTTLSGIVGRMYSDLDKIEKHRAQLNKFDHEMRNRISKELAENCQFTTRVHAEMQLVDAFTNANLLKFYNPKDPYIACSKRACYLCARYVKTVATHIQLRGSHEKIYLNWRPPDIQRDASNATQREKAREKAMNDMVKVLRRELEQHLENRLELERRYKHPDSSTGITKIRRPPGTTKGLTNSHKGSEESSTTDSLANSLRKVNLAGSGSTISTRLPPPAATSARRPLRSVIERDDEMDEEEEEEEEEEEDEPEGEFNTSVNTFQNFAGFYQPQPYEDGDDDDAATIAGTYAPSESDFDRESRFAHSESDFDRESRFAHSESDFDRESRFAHSESDFDRESRFAHSKYQSDSDGDDGGPEGGVKLG